MSIKIDFDKVNMMNGKILKKHFEGFDFVSSYHHIIFHGTGVVDGYKENCNVHIIRNEVPFEFELRPGALIDGKGRLIHIDKAITYKFLNYHPGPKEAQIFLYVHVSEEKTQLDDLTNVIKYVPQFLGSLQELKGSQYIEVARIFMEQNARKIAYPENPDQPRSGEIDRRHVRFIPVSVQPFTPREKHRILRGVDDRRKIINSLQFIHSDIAKIPQLMDFKFSLMSTQMNLVSGTYGRFHLKEILTALINFEIEFIDLFKKQVQSEPHFLQILSTGLGILAQCRKILNGNFSPDEHLNEVMELYFSKMNENYRKLFSEFQKDFSFYAQSCAQFDKIIVLEDQKYRLLKVIDFENPEKKKEKGWFTFPEGEPPWESSHPLVYGDGSKLNSVLVTFKQAYIELPLADLATGKDVLIFSASPGAHASIPLYVTMDENQKFQFQIPVELNGHQEQGINKYILIPSKFIKQNNLKLKIHTRRGNELYMMKFWVYQKI
jgi:hypothetical protein